MRVTNYYYCYWHHQTRSITCIATVYLFIFMYLSMSNIWNSILYFIIIWHLMRWYFDNLFLMRQLLLESKGASTYSLYPPAEQINYSYRIGIRGVGYARETSFKNWRIGDFTWIHLESAQQVIPVERFPCQHEELSSKAWGLNLYLVQTSLSSGRLHILLVSKE